MAATNKSLLNENIANTRARELLSINETADIFGIGRARLRELIRVDSTIPAITIGTHTKIHSGLFAEWLKKTVLEGKAL